MLENAKTTVVSTSSNDQEAGSAPSNTEGQPRSSRLWSALPSALILVALVGVAYWGHQTGWRVGSTGSSELSGKPNGDHTFTVIRSSRDASNTWCAAHGVHGCSLDFPEIAQLDKSPSITSADLQRAQRALSVRPRHENDPKFSFAGDRLRFQSAEAVSRAGIDITPAWNTALTEAISASGEVLFDPTRTARVTSRAPGTARYVAKKVGDSVHAGEVLALVDAAEVGKAKAELLHALVQSRLKKKALANLQAAGTSIPERQLKEADASLRDAETRLLSSEQGLANLGLPVAPADLAAATIEDVAHRIQWIGVPETLVAELVPEARTSNLLPIRAPLEGAVLSCDVIPGEVVDTSKVLFTIVDYQRMWATLHVSMEDAQFVSVDAPVQFRPDGTRDDFTGKVVWIGTAADEKTRLVPVRVELANEHGRLRASTLGTGRIILREEPDALAVPTEAVHPIANCEVVFVRHKDFLKPDGPKEFFVRTVRTGIRDGAMTEIVVGLLPGEVVATKGSAFLINELNKSHRSGR